MIAATRIVDPSLADPSIGGMHKDLVDYRERAARCLVKRVVAALCGIDDGLPVPEYSAEYSKTRLDSFVVLPRNTLAQLRAALLNDDAVVLLEEKLGPDATAELLGALSIIA